MRRSLSGFTLIEVMVALAIVAVTLGAGIRAAGALTQNTQRVSDIAAAQWCADNRITDLRLMRLYPDIGDSAWSCDQLGRTYPGHEVVRPTPNPNFRRVDEQVMDDGGNPIVTLSTVLSR